jgi:ankyrin repeat protein
VTGKRPSGDPKTPSRTLDDILASCSDSLFPAQIGRAKVHLQSVDCDGDTPLHVLLRRNDTEAVLMLIAAGARINAVGDMSETPLHIAVRQRNADAVEALLKAGADPEAMSEFGETPRSLATAQGAWLRKLFGNK